MSCEKWNLKLSGYVDGTLSPQEQAHVQVHLRTCEACRSEMEALRRTAGLLATFEPRRLSPGFDSRLRQQLEQVSSRPFARAGLQPSRWPAFFRPSRSVAAAAALLAAGVLSWQLYPAQSAHGSYVAACVQAHASLPATVNTHPITTRSVVPDAELVDEETD